MPFPFHLILNFILLLRTSIFLTTTSTKNTLYYTLYVIFYTLLNILGYLMVISYHKLICIVQPLHLDLARFSYEKFNILLKIMCEELTNCTFPLVLLLEREF